MPCKLGLDTGGTFTDAVLLDDSGSIVAHAKSPTTHHDLSIGLSGALSELLGQHSVASNEVSLVSLSTTLATNALVEGHGRRVCLILVGFSPGQLKRARLAEVMGSDPVVFIDGGHNAAGEAVTEPDLQNLKEQLDAIDQQVDAFAVTAMFAVRNPAHEILVRDWLLGQFDKPVSCGYELSSALDAPRRALTAVLNARLIPLINNLLKATAGMLEERGIDAPLMVVKGDGSLVSQSVATISPVETILSGPAASVVGAGYLSELKNAVVSDMGGTTTDIAVVEDGRPMLDPEGATVGGWTTMVRAIRINTYGLGGDSQIHYDREERCFRIGPQRVTPVSRFLHRYPELVDELERQLELPFSTTHSGQFVFIPALALGNAGAEKTVPEEPPGLSGQQRELWVQLLARPISLQKLFEDQTLDLAYRRLLAAGHVAQTSFTPTDALVVLGDETLGNGPLNPRAAKLAAELLARYSRQNLGPEWNTADEFAAAMREQVARDTALAVIETVLARESSLPSPANPDVVSPVAAGKRQHPGKKIRKQQVARQGLHQQKRQLLSDVFEGGGSALSLRAELSMPLIGLGAPAIGYYDRVAELLSTQADVPNLAGVANAIGAVVGSVAITRSLTITPVGGIRVQVHAENGPQEYPNLEQAAEAAREELIERTTELAAEAGAVDIQTQSDRKDVVAENQGEKVFFESTITVSAAGRPASTEDKLL